MKEKLNELSVTLSDGIFLECLKKRLKHWHSLSVEVDRTEWLKERTRLALNDAEVIATEILEERDR